MVGYRTRRSLKGGPADAYIGAQVSQDIRTASGPLDEDATAHSLNVAEQLTR